ncbi:MAG: KamA family radical SAM protein [Thermodesulfobacteriota bacterium]
MEALSCLETAEEPPEQPPSRVRPLRREPPAAASRQERLDRFRRAHFADASDRDWNDWRWQIRNRITSFSRLGAILDLSPRERLALTGGRGGLPLSITPYYASLLDPADPAQPLRRCVVPVAEELTVHAGESQDPLHEDHDSPVPNLVHRYPDRALFLTTNFCSVYCRYCTRSRLVGKRQRNGYGPALWERAVDYIARTPSIRDVVLSGGDPLTMPDKWLEWLLVRLRQIPHLEIVRIGTKVPMVLPQRITPALVKMLRRFHPLWMSIHCTHPDELTPEATAACNRLADAGIPLGSQTVLLKGVNDEPATMKALMHGLMKVRIKPYYLYQCDPIVGSHHFRTPVRSGLDIYQSLRGHTSGYAVPNYVIDAPGGGGKIPLIPETVVGIDGEDLLIRNFENRVFRYPDTAGQPAVACAEGGGHG